MSDFNQLLGNVLMTAVQTRVSDVHFSVGAPPAFRTNAGVVPLNVPPFTAEQMAALCSILITEPEVRATLPKLRDYDGSYEAKGIGRFRVNIFRQKKNLAAVLRVVQEKVPSIDELKLPPVLKTIAEASRGLVLVTGATGSGKSSTLAAIIDHINTTQACHIMTIEDPIEYMHSWKKSRISQREVGSDTDSFAIALRAALRQDPDVVLVGEMRDIETLDIALKAAETGHLVFSTVHTTDAIKTIGRLVAMYPPEEQNMVRLRLSDNLNATISQRLVPAADGKGKVVVQEIMIANTAIRECIAIPEKTGEMNTFIEKGKDILGSQTFDQHLSELVNKKIISIDVALETATNRGDFERNLAFGEGGGGAASIKSVQMEGAGSPPSIPKIPDLE